MSKIVLQEMNLKELLQVSGAWTTVSRAADLEGVSRGRIYQWIWAGKRKAAKFVGVILVVPGPRKRKKNKVGRPRKSEVNS